MLGRNRFVVWIIRVLKRLTDVRIYFLFTAASPCEEGDFYTHPNTPTPIHSHTHTHTLVPHRKWSVYRKRIHQWGQSSVERRWIHQKRVHRQLMSSFAFLLNIYQISEFKRLQLVSAFRFFSSFLSISNSVGLWCTHQFILWYIVEFDELCAVKAEVFSDWNILAVV